MTQDPYKIRNIAIIAHVESFAYEETKSFLIDTFGVNPNLDDASRPCLLLPEQKGREL